MSEEIKWLALESNPDILNIYMKTLGVPNKWQFVDILGIDNETLQWIPHPVIAILLLYPITEETIKEDEKQIKKIQQEGQYISPKLWYIKQTIRNACGTIGVLHSLANNEDIIEFQPDTPIYNFIKKTKNLDPIEKANLLIHDKSISEAHKENAKEGQTETPDINSDLNLHFIAFVHKDGYLYELDGRKSFPINHGPSSKETLLEDSAKIIQEFFSRNKESNDFSMMALVSIE
jgi:ubiquitin carboxyl-terminal hydrolase L3